MFPAIDDIKYGQLLIQTSPRKIETEEQNERYLEIIESYVDKGAANFSPEEHALFDLLVTLVEEFETRYYPMPNTQPHERFRSLLEDRGVKQKDLVGIFGSEGNVSDTVNGRRQISLKTARKLADHFKVPIDLFI